MKYPLRSRFLKTVFFALITIPAINVSAATASTQDVHEIADICMYAQRLLKDYAMIGMGVTYHNPAADLAKNSKMIDRYFADVESHQLKKKLDAEVREIHALWDKIKPQLLHKPEKNKMLALREAVEKFTKRCEEVADHLAEDTKIKGEHEVVLIAQLGMEVQRLSALYMMKAWGVSDPDYYKHVDEILNEYEDIYHELQKADNKLVSKEIKIRLKKAESRFLAFKFMAASKSGRFIPTLAEKTSSEIFYELREILKLEEELVE